MGEVVAAVESDVALVITVLRIANRNSPAQEGQDRRDPRGGRDPLAGGRRDARVARATFDFFERTPGWDLMPERFRLHAVATQAAADRLARELEYEDRDELLCSALLHDIGKLVLSHAYPGYPARSTATPAPPRSACTSERLELGVDHALVGGVLARRWALPNRLALRDRAPPRRRRRGRGRARAARRHARPLRPRAAGQPEGAAPGRARAAA